MRIASTLLRWILKFGAVFVVITILCDIVWEEFVDGTLYNCTDAAFGYLSPDGWVGGNNFPVVTVKKVVSGRPLSEPDELKEGWSVPRLWMVWCSLFTGSFIASFLLASIRWRPDAGRSSGPRGGESSQPAGMAPLSP